MRLLKEYQQLIFSNPSPNDSFCFSTPIELIWQDLELESGLIRNDIRSVCKKLNEGVLGPVDAAEHWSPLKD
jgi:hypothetical protein